jgi:hypothetical protein
VLCGKITDAGLQLLVDLQQLSDPPKARLDRSWRPLETCGTAVTSAGRAAFFAAQKAKAAASTGAEPAAASSPQQTASKAQQQQAATATQQTASATASAAELEELRAKAAKAAQLEAELAAAKHLQKQKEEQLAQQQAAAAAAAAAAAPSTPAWLSSLMTKHGIQLDDTAIQALVRHAVSEQVFLALTRDDLSELGLTDFAARKTVLMLVDAAKNQPSAAPAAAASPSNTASRFSGVAQLGEAKFAVPFLPFPLDGYKPTHGTALAALQAFSAAAGVPPQVLQTLLPTIGSAAQQICTSGHGHTRGQSLDECTAIVAYTADVRQLGSPKPEHNMWVVLNGVLRSRKVDDIQPGTPLADLFAWLISGLRKIPTHAPATVYRGVNQPLTQLWDAYKNPGTTVVWPAFTSTSLDPHVMSQFAQQGGAAGAAGRTLIAIKANAARSLQDYSLFSSEQELLLAPNTMLKVVVAVSSAQVAALGALPGVQLPAGADLVVLEQVSTPEHAKVV